MRVHVYTMLHNEELMLPYFLRHYGPIAEKIVVFDNESTDRTVEIALDGGAGVVPISTGGFHKTAVLQKVMNEAYKASRGKADWVICAEGDEFFWHPDLVNLLYRYRKEGITLPKVDGYDMVSEKAPSGPGQIYDEIKIGAPNWKYGKRGIFHPDIEINFTPGGHRVEAAGNVVENETAEIKLLHYRFLGEDYYASRNGEHRARISPENIARRWGTECLFDHIEKYRVEVEKVRPNLIQVVP